MHAGQHCVVCRVELVLGEIVAVLGEACGEEELGGGVVPLALVHIIGQGSNLKFAFIHWDQEIADIPTAERVAKPPFFFAAVSHGAFKNAALVVKFHNEGLSADGHRLGHRL